jgi:hypothetical protein
MKFAESTGSFFHEATVGVLIGLISLLLSQGIGRLEERGRDGERAVGGAVRTHTTFIE